jgi:hypothetical protein
LKARLREDEGENENEGDFLLRVTYLLLFRLGRIHAHAHGSVSQVEVAT